MKRFRSKIACLLVATISMSTILTGCSSSNSDKKENNPPSQEKELAENQVFRYTMSGDPSVLDPAHYRDDNTGTIVTALNEPLLRVSNDDDGWEPGLATDFTVSDDYLTYTFNLRKDAKWEDGTPITANDVEYSFKRVLDPNTASRKAFDYYFIKNGEKVNKGELGLDELGINAKDDYTVEFALEKPLDYFIELIKGSACSIVQKDAAEKNGELYGTGTGTVVASGPFKLTDWQHDHKLILEKNENYWDAENVTLDKIEISIIADGNTLTGLYQTGELDFLDVSADFLDTYKSSGQFTNMPQAGIQFIEFNPNKAYLENVNIREALSMTINRDVYVNNITKDGSKPAYGMVPYGIRGKGGSDFREQAGDITTDISQKPEYAQQAKDLLDKGLQEIGKTKEDMTKELTMHCIDSPGSKRIAQAIQQMWKESLGVELALIPLQVKMLLPVLESQSFDIVVGGGRVAPVNDPADFIDFVYNEGKWNNEEYKSLIEQSRETTGDERMEFLMQAEKVLLDNYVFIPLNFSSQNFMTREGVEGLRVYPSSVRQDFKYVQIYEVK